MVFPRARVSWRRISSGQAVRRSRESLQARSPGQSQKSPFALRVERIAEGPEGRSGIRRFPPTVREGMAGIRRRGFDSDAVTTVRHQLWNRGAIVTGLRCSKMHAVRIAHHRMTPTENTGTMRFDAELMSEPAQFFENSL